MFLQERETLSSSWSFTCNMPFPFPFLSILTALKVMITHREKRATCGCQTYSRTSLSPSRLIRDQPLKTIATAVKGGHRSVKQPLCMQKVQESVPGIAFPLQYCLLIPYHFFNAMWKLVTSLDLCHVVYRA